MLPRGRSRASPRRTPPRWRRHSTSRPSASSGRTGSSLSRQLWWGSKKLG